MRNIRPANKFDLPHVLTMLRHFRDNAPIQKIAQCNNEQYINSLYHSILAGRGVAFIAEDIQPVGLIMGVVDTLAWDPDIRVLKELVYWVEPDHRNTTLGYRLLNAYCNKAKELLNTNQIQMYTIAKMVNSPDLDYSKFGFTKAEEIWVAGI